MKACSSTSILEIHKYIVNLRKKYSFNLVDRDSRGLWLKTKKQRTKKMVGRHKWHRGVLGNFNIKISNRKQIILSYYYKNQFIFLKKQNPPEPLAIYRTFFYPIFQNPYVISK